MVVELAVEAAEFVREVARHDVALKARLVEDDELAGGRVPGDDVGVADDQLRRATAGTPAGRRCSRLPPIVGAAVHQISISRGERDERRGVAGQRARVVGSRSLPTMVRILAKARRSRSNALWPSGAARARPGAPWERWMRKKCTSSGNPWTAPVQVGVGRAKLFAERRALRVERERARGLRGRGPPDPRRAARSASKSSALLDASRVVGGGVVVAGGL